MAVGQPLSPRGTGTNLMGRGTHSLTGAVRGYRFPSKRSSEGGTKRAP